MREPAEVLDKKKIAWIMSRVNPIIDIEDFATTDYDELIQMHPVDLMKEMDMVVSKIETFTREFRGLCKPKKGMKSPRHALWHDMWHDLEMEFSQWSHKINKSIRANIKLFVAKEDPEENDLWKKYRWVYAYWWNRWTLINDVYKKYSRSAPKKRLRNIERARDTLCKLIEGELTDDQIHDSFKAAIDKINLTLLTKGTGDEEGSGNKE